MSFTSISAASGEKLRAMARDYDQAKRDGRSERPEWSIPARLPVTIRNDSGEDRAAFDVLGIDDSDIDPDADPKKYKERIMLVGSTPSEADHQGRFAILLRAAADGETVPCCVAGVCQAWIDMQDEDDSWADITDGDAGMLTSGPSGAAEILLSTSGTGEQWCIVRIGAGAKGSPRCNATLAEEMTTAEGPFDVDGVVPIDGNPSPVSSPSETIEVYNTFGWEADDNAVCKIEWNEDAQQWEFYQVQCPAS